jgi:hypothetical protein
MSGMKTMRAAWSGAILAASLLAGCGGGSGGSGGPGDPPPPPPPPAGPAWLNHGRDAQHSGTGGAVAAQTLSRMVWRTDVDLAPVRREQLLASGHYGTAHR